MGAVTATQCAGISESMSPDDDGAGPVRVAADEGTGSAATEAAGVTLLRSVTAPSGGARGTASVDEPAPPRWTWILKSPHSTSISVPSTLWRSCRISPTSPNDSSGTSTGSSRAGEVSINGTTVGTI